MNLSEYCNQLIPEKMPMVVLTNLEFTISESIKVGIDTLNRIIINFPITENWRAEYIQKNNESRLLTTDKDGNPKVYSCFYIPKK